VYCVVATVIGWPIGALFWELAGSQATAILQNATSLPIRTAVIDTVVVSAVTTVLALAVGGGAALAIDRLRPPGAAWLRLGLLLPLVIPPFVSAFGWRQAYGTAGLTQHLIGWQLAWLESGAGVGLLLGVQGVPLAFLSVTAALSVATTRELERAARACGASAWMAVRTVTLPLAGPALGAAAGLIYLASASDFGIPAVLGIPGRFPTVTTQIYQYLSFSASANSFTSALLLAAVLAVIALLILPAIGRVSAGHVALRLDVAHVRGKATAGPPAWGAAVALFGYVTFTAVGPLIALVLVALTRAYGLDPVPDNWSMVHFGDVLTGSLGAAFGRSLLLALLSAVLLVGVGTASATISHVRRWGAALDAVVALPFAVPGSTIAIGVILAFSRVWYGTLAIILVAYVARFWVLAERPALAALAQIGPDPLRAARVSGAGQSRAWWTGVWPGIRPAVIVGAALVFVSAVHELTVSALLYAPGTETIAVAILNRELAGDVASTAAIGVLLVILVLVVAVPVLVAAGRLARGQRVD
jgi:iron(III) transport system permease protein